MITITWLNIVSFLLIGVCSIYSVKNLKHKCKDDSSIGVEVEEKKLYDFLVVLFFVVAFCFRTYNFSKVPLGINQDEAMAAYEAKSLLMYGTDRFGMKMPIYFTAWQFAQMNVLESFLMIPFIKIFGLNIFSARLPMAIVCLISIYIVFDFVKSMFGKNEALVALFFLAINPWHFMISRWALESNMFPNFVLFAMYFLYLGLTKKERYLYISMIFFGLCMYAYGIAYFAIPFLLLIIAIWLIYKKIINIKKIIFCVIFYLLISWPIFVMIYINYFKMESIELPFITIPFFPDQIRNESMLPFCDNKFELAVNNFYNFLSKAVFQLPDAPWNYISKIGTSYLFSTPFLFLGIYDLHKNKTYNKIGVFIIDAWLMTALMTALIINNANVNQDNILFFPVIICTSVGLYKILFSKEFNRVSGIILVSFCCSFIFFLVSYFGNFKRDMEEYYYHGFGNALEYAEDSGKEKLYITMNTMGEGFQQVSEILTLFYLDIDPHYFQGVVNEQVPYNEKYIYKNFREEPYFDDYDGIYIFNLSEIDLFPSDVFDLNIYAYYGAATLK